MTQLPSFKTPVLECRWAHIKDPDTQYDKNGVYHIDLVLDKNNPEHKKLVQHLRSFRPDGAANDVGKTDKDDPTKFIVKCKQQAWVEDSSGKKHNIVPVVYDSQARRVVNVPLIGNGSKVSVSITPRPYSKSMKGGGVRLQPEAIQIVELVEFVAEAPTHDFAPVDGGFTVPEGPGFTPVDGGYQEDSGQPKAQTPENVEQPPLEAYDDFDNFDQGQPQQQQQPMANPGDFEDF